MKESMFKLALTILALSVACISIYWMRGAFHVYSPRSGNAPSFNPAQSNVTTRSGNVLVRFKEFEFGKDWNADFEITNGTSRPAYYVGSNGKYRFAYCTLAAKRQEQFLNVSFKIRDICYESTILGLQLLQPGESLILAVEKQDVRDLLHTTDANSEIKAQIGFEFFLGDDSHREILWSDEVTFPRSDGH